MKAITVNFSLGREAWDRVKASIFQRGDDPRGLTVELTEMPEPDLPGPRWVKIRSVLSGISLMDESLVVSHDPACFGAFLTFPFVPGNENVGIITETGKEVKGLELGERVVVDPLLSCVPRGIKQLCPGCSAGEPTHCTNFAVGLPGPGLLIGGCRDTGGGWGDYFVAHESQLRVLPHNLETDHAVMVPELVRALKAVLKHPPAPNDRVIVVGAGPLGLLTLLVLRALGHYPPLAVVTEHAFEADMARRLTNARVVLSHGPGTAYDEVAEFVGGKVQYPSTGRITLAGGADLIYETTGSKEHIEEALRFAGEGKRAVLMGLKDVTGFDLTPLWLKGVKLEGVGFSGTAIYEGTERNLFDVAMDVVQRKDLSLGDMVTHRFKQEEYRKAFSAIENRHSGKTLKVLFQHVV